MENFGISEIVTLILIAACVVVHEMLGQFLRKSADPRKDETATAALVIATLSIRMAIFGALFVFIMALTPLILGSFFGKGLYKVTYPAALAFFVASFKLAFDAGKLAFFSKIDTGLLPAFAYSRKYVGFPLLASVLPLSAYWITF